MFELTGKKAFVTGASRGIGRGIALCLSKQGADVAINYVLSKELADQTVSEIKNQGRDSFSIQGDVSKSQDVKRMFEEIKSKWGKLDILVNNAGVISYAPFEELTEEQWDKVINTNLKGQFLCSKFAIPLMNQGSRIINIASIASGGVGVGFLNIDHYAASKGGVIALTEGMAIDLAKKGINVNAVAPGAIETDMAKGSLETEQSKNALLSRIPKGRIGKPEDIGAAACFLASNEADYITGTVIYVDGGWLAS